MRYGHFEEATSANLLIFHREHPHPRLLMRGLSRAKVEIGLATMAYNLKRITNVLGATKLTETLHQA
jgi:transposase